MLRILTADEMDDLLPAALTGQLTLVPQAADEPSPILTGADQLAEKPAVVIHTSGSTGRPKAVALSAAALLASAAATHQHLGRPLDWVSALPFRYVAGLMTTVRAFQAGTTAQRCAPDLADLVVPEHPAAISLVPTQLGRALADPALSRQLAQFELVLLGGAAADAALLEAASQRGVRVVTSYGMSETCGGCVYDGVPLPGVEIIIDHDSRVWVAGPMLFSGYLGDPELTAASLQHGRLRTHDRGQWRDGRLTIKGRFDEVVISGGVNVDLAQAQTVIDHLADQPSVLVGAPHREWGTAVVLVTQNDPVGSSRSLEQWKQLLSDAGLGSAALPKAVKVVDELPRLSSGKIDRQTLATLVEGIFEED